MDILITIIAKAFWCGFAALGFGILFNSPERAFRYIYLGGFLAGLVKYGAMVPSLGAGVISASFLAACMVGLASIPIAHKGHVPPIIFSIPSVIPLVPGVFAYRTMLGLMKLTGEMGLEYNDTLAETFQNGSVTLLIIISLAFGVAVPMHILRTRSVKNLRLKKKD